MSRWRDWIVKAATKRQDKPKLAAASDSVADVIAKALASAGLLKNAQAETGEKRKADRSAPHTDSTRFFWDVSGEGPRLLDYKVYLPSNASVSSNALPLVVMLHGCTQDPDDFATGTRMNALAEKHGFIVAYPRQPSTANPSKCWNWFRPEDQHRDSGEPQRIVQMVRDLVGRYHIDPARVYVAGMSAGAAMAVILAHTYPDLFAAVAAHSGLPYGAATNVVSALSVMKKAQAIPSRAKSALPLSVPIVIFHGDQDSTVDHSNAVALVEQAIVEWPSKDKLTVQSTTRFSEGGRICDRVAYQTPQGNIAIDYWVIRGAGHLWAGGNPRGSHTDANGPDASAHFWDFFNSHTANAKGN